MSVWLYELGGENEVNIGKRRIALAMAIIMIIVTVLAACASLDKGTDKLPEGTVAVVNNTNISIDEFNKMVTLQKLIYEAELGQGILNEVVDGVTFLDYLKQNILEQMVMDEIVIQKSEDGNIEITEDDIEENYQMFLSMLGDDKEFLKILEENGLDEEFIKKVVIAKSLITEFYTNEYLYKLEIGEDEAKQHYEDNIEMYQNEQIHARHILMADRTLAEEVLEKVKNGEDFKSLAMKYGEDETRESGGDLGTFGKGRMAPEFEEPVFKLEKGEVSDIIETRSGYHIVLVEDKNVTEIPFEEIKDQITEEVRAIEFDKHLKGLWEKADIKMSSKL